MTDISQDVPKKAKEAPKDQATKDFELWKAIEKVLGRDGGPERVLLAGEAGIGKTRLAKMVGEKVVATQKCFLTICVHLNKKFVDELSLYENIASQLCVYSDFEETEVDDRDEDEDEVKTREEVLADLKDKITKEIERKRKLVDEKKDDQPVTNARVTEIKNPPVTGPKDKTGVPEPKPTEEGKKGLPKKPYLLLILDDEGIEVTDENDAESEDDVASKAEVTTELEVTNKEEVTNKGEMKSEDEGEIKQEAPSNVKEPKVGEEEPKVTEKPKVVEVTVGVTSEDRVLNELKLKAFLLKQFPPKESYRLKMLVTKRDGDKKPTEPDNKNENQSDDNENKGGSDNENQSDDNENKGDSGSENQSGDNKNESDDEIKTTEEKSNEGKSDPSQPDNSERTKPDGETGDDQSHVLRDTLTMVNMEELLKSLIMDEWNTDEAWIREMVEHSKHSPAAIFVLAKSLKQIILKPSYKNDAERIKEEIKEVLSVHPGGSINPILHLAYWLLKYFDERLKDAILDCFWHSLDFFERCGCVYYRDLITQWILEGYFDPVRSVEKAYQDGHLILMELINRGMLKIQENNVVVPERAMNNLIDPRRDGLFKNSRLRFSQVYRGNRRKGLGKITQIDDMIKTVQAKKGDKMTTILVSGDRLRRVTPAKYFAKLEGLEVLGMFEPTLEPFLPELLKVVGTKRLETLDNLRVLVIRDCDLLDDIEGLTVLHQLQALEVSGASSLKKISDNFFKAFLKLQSLHLSGLMIPSSPSSISLLKKLHCLIIKDCPLLKDLPDIQELTELEVVDVSGAHGLQTCFDNTPGNKKDKSKNKNFYHLTKLQLLDFSESQIERLPIFQDSADAKPLHSVTRLLLRDCSKLRRLPSLKPLSGLQILDLSGTTSLVEMLEVCFEEKKELKSINFSRTNLSELATTIEELTGLMDFLLKDCTNIESIPNITPLENLEVFDVSGSTKLKTIDVSFEKMLYLREVNLSGTQVKTPELPTESKIYGKKCITLANGISYEGKDWKEVKARMPDEGSDEASSSAAVVDDEEISEKKPEDARSSAPVVTRENQPNQPLTSVPTERGDVSKERLLQVPVERTLYKTTLDFFKVPSQLEIMEINETDVVDDEALAKAEFVSFGDCSSKRIASIFNKTKSVKGCLVRFCMDIVDLFTAVDVERLELLETLSITNLPLLETISCGGSLKNLKKLTVEYCPYIIKLFPEASQPSNLEVLHIKYCEKLEKVSEGVRSIANLIVKKEGCLSFTEESVGPEWDVVHQGEIHQGEIQPAEDH